MKPISFFKYLQLTMMSSPGCDREVYKTVRKQQIRSIVEIGVGDAKRAQNMIRLASKYCGQPMVRYTGIDMFEGRSGEVQIDLRTAHKQLKLPNSKVRLVPGNLQSGLPAIANAHTRTDLIVISGEYQQEELESTWMFMPRMLHPQSIVMVQPAGETNAPFRVMGRLEIERMAKAQSDGAAKSAAA